MTYFYPNKKVLLKNIDKLTKEKSFTSASELYALVSLEERKAGYGTGNIQNTLRELFQDGHILFSGIKSTFDIPVNYSDMQNISIILTQKGYERIDVWYKRAYRFVLYERHNLFVLFSLVLSIIALVLSA
jgi:hypothetical protein